MRKQTESKWSLGKSYHSTGSSSAALSERFFQTLRKQTVKPLHHKLEVKDRNRNYKLSLGEQPKHLALSKRALNLNKKGKQSSAECTDRLRTKQIQANKIYFQENKIHKLKDKFQKILKRKDCFVKSATVTLMDIKVSISGMEVIPYNHKHFNEIFDSILQMIQVPSRQLLAINLFIILLGFHNILLTQRQLRWILPNQQNRRNLITLSKQEIVQMHNLHQFLNNGSEPASKQNPLIVSVTLPNKQKQQNLFSGTDDFKDIAGSLMSKYNIPQKKRKNMERILLSKLQQKKLI